MYLFKQVIVLFYLIFFFLKRKSNPYEDKCFFIFWPSTFNEFLHYFGRAYILQDVTLYIALKTRYQNIIFIRENSLKNLNSKENVFYSAVPFRRGSLNQGEALFYRLSKYKLNFVPSPNEIRLWENKDFMHYEFERLNIPTPYTLIINHDNFFLPSNISFPILTKILNGNHSRGIISHKDETSLLNYLLKMKNRSIKVLLQEQLDIKFDIRVVTVNFKVEYYYWRDKVNSDEFTTTSTSNGSILRLDLLPREVVDCAEDASIKLGLRLAAFDITFFNIDSKIVPIIFEVSSSFLLNPLPQGKYLNLPYKVYKDSVFLFTKNRISQFINLKTKYVKNL